MKNTITHCLNALSHSSRGCIVYDDCISSCSRFFSSFSLRCCSPFLFNHVLNNSSFSFCYKIKMCSLPIIFADASRSKIICQIIKHHYKNNGEELGIFDGTLYKVNFTQIQEYNSGSPVLILLPQTLFPTVVITSINMHCRNHAREAMNSTIYSQFHQESYNMQGDSRGHHQHLIQNSRTRWYISFLKMQILEIEIKKVLHWQRSNCQQCYHMIVI